MHASLVLQRLSTCADGPYFRPSNSTLETLFAPFHAIMVSTFRAPVLSLMKQGSSLLMFDMSGSWESGMTKYFKTSTNEDYGRVRALMRRAGYGSEEINSVGEVSVVSFDYRNKTKESRHTYRHNKVTLGCGVSIISSASP